MTNPSKFGNWETTTYDGALRLCGMIKDYWAAQGKTVMAWPFLLPGRPAERDKRVWIVKSDIVINRFDAPLPAAVERVTPLEHAHYRTSPHKEAA